MLDIECFSFLNRALESDLAPLVIMASNRGVSRIRGTKYRSPHGIPIDLLDRMLIIATRNYEPAEVREIVEIRCVPLVLGRPHELALRADPPFLFVPSRACSCQEEDVSLSPAALTLLTEIGTTTSLRYALQLISPAHLVALRRKADGGRVDEADVTKVYGYFVDAERSKEFVHDMGGKCVAPLAHLLRASILGTEAVPACPQ
jgi:RuvB-like protein 2